MAAVLAATASRARRSWSIWTWQSGEGERVAAVLAVFFDDGAEFGAPVEGGAADAGVGGDGVEGDGGAGRRASWAAGAFDANGGFVGHGVSVLVQELVEAFDEAAVAGGFLAPAAGVGVGGQRRGVGALGGQDRQEGRFGAEVRAVLADVGVGAGSLGRGAQAVSAGQSRLDRRGVLPVGAAGR